LIEEEGKSQRTNERGKKGPGCRTDLSILRSLRIEVQFATEIKEKLLVGDERL